MMPLCSSWWLVFVAALQLAVSDHLHDLKPYAKIHVDPASGHYMDSAGRTRIFHGVNVVYKKHPWYPRSDKFTPEDSLDDSTMELLRQWGFNVVRLGVMWPGVEPLPRQINQDYLDEIQKLAARLADHGVYTIVDLHQDLGSRRFCGEGFPEHYIDALLRDPHSQMSKAAPFPAPFIKESDLPKNASGFPLLEDCLKHPFPSYYNTYQVGAMWEELYTPNSDLNKGFQRFWGAVAAKLKDSPQILAYELLNEPSDSCLDGSYLGCARDSVPVRTGNEVETQKLTPLYEAAARAIRATGAKQPILYEATVDPKFGAAPFNKPALGNDTQQGLAYHIYCEPGDGDSTAKAALCDAAQAIFERNFYSFLKKHRGMAGFMTEFGAVGGNQLELKHLDQLLAKADGLFQSWAYWQLKKYEDFTTANAAESLYDEHGKLNVPKLKTLSRTYARAIAGIPLRMSFDPSTANFVLQFNATVADAPTVIYLNEGLHYPTGADLVIEPAHCMRMGKPMTNYMHLLLSQHCLGQHVSVEIKRKEGTETLVI